jgi:hypothetical protein
MGLQVLGRYNILDIAANIFIFHFKVIFIYKIEHIVAIEEGLAGEQSDLASVANKFLLDQPK